ncbi:Hypothetical predicted protein [Olea europaea subsp. europaea]|uniref:Uncharacterized protein n=1 Tax=Olea europaea subsp. europaea TaxID=158383 RepID=A0A8S0V076_OLEEU|nr:Hypothetical predicted protein [Olea europaea subsp. europaea]
MKKKNLRWFSIIFLRSCALYMDLIDELFESYPTTSSNSRRETMDEESFDQTYDSIKNLSLSEGEKFEPSGLIKTTSMEREEQAQVKSRQETMVEKSFDQTYESIKNLSLSEGEKFMHSGLIKTTSMEREEQAQAKVSQFARRKSNIQGRLGLGRAPSLPTTLELEEFQDEESDFRMGKLIRQASLIHSDMSPPSPRHTSSKAMAQSCSQPRNQPGRKKPGLKNLKIEGTEHMRKQYPASQIKSSRSLTDLEFEEVQGFKDLGFNFDKVQDLNPSVVSILPGLKDEKRVKSAEEENMRRPFLSEAWMAQNSSSSSSKRSTEDMKTQIKFWARAVASNASADH